MAQTITFDEVSGLAASGGSVQSALQKMTAALQNLGDAGGQARAVLDQLRESLRATAAQCRITYIAQKGNKLVFTLEEFQLKPFSALCGLDKYKKRLVLIPGDTPRFSLAVGKGEDPLRAASGVVDAYARALEEE